MSSALIASIVAVSLRFRLSALLRLARNPFTTISLPAPSSWTGTDAAAESPAASCARASAAARTAAAPDKARTDFRIRVRDIAFSLPMRCRFFGERI